MDEQRDEVRLLWESAGSIKMHFDDEDQEKSIDINSGDE